MISTMADLRLQPEKAAQAEAALEAAIKKLTSRQRALARSCPEVLRRLAHLSAAPPRRGEVAEDVAADALPRVSRRLQLLASPERAQAVDQFFQTNKSSLLPICTAVAVALHGPADLRAVAERIRSMLDEGPEQGLIARFGPTAYCWRQSDSVETIWRRLRAGPTRRRRWPKLCEPASAAEVEALALRWDDYRPEPAREHGRLVFDVSLSKSVNIGRR